MKMKMKLILAVAAILPAALCYSQSSIGIGMAFGDGGHPAPLVRAESQINLQRAAITLQGRGVVAGAIYATGGILFGYNIWFNGKPKFQVGMVDEQTLKLIPSVGVFYNKFSPLDKPDVSGSSYYPAFSLKLVSEKYTWEIFDQRRVIGASITWIIKTK